VGVVDGRRAEHHALRAHPEGVVDSLGAPEAAAELDGDADCVDDLLHDLEVPRLAGARAVQVHDVERPGALLHPAPGGVNRVGVEGGLAVVVALHQADRTTAADVDGRVEDHAGTHASTNRASSPRPASLDFSGWNCTPQIGPRSTAQAKRS